MFRDPTQLYGHEYMCSIDIYAMHKQTLYTLCAYEIVCAVGEAIYAKESFSYLELKNFSLYLLYLSIW